jgi:hypothetical protein
MLWNYSSLEYCLYIGPDCILCPLKWHFSWFCTHFYWSFQNFLYVSWWPGLPSRVLFHLFRILTRMIFLYKAAAHPYSHSWNSTHRWWVLLSSRTQTEVSNVLSSTGSRRYYPVWWSTNQTSKFANTSYFCCRVLPPQMIRVFVDSQLSVLSAEDRTLFPSLLWLTLCASFFSMASAEPLIAVTLVQTFY